jgi:putative aldouronate transport system permease protein
MRKQKDFMNISWRWNTFFLLVLIFFAVVTVAPVALLISSSFQTRNALPRVAFGFIPNEFTLEGYEFLFALVDQLWRSYLVSFEYAGFGTALMLFNTSLFAYVLYQPQRKFWWRKFYTWLMFITMIFGGGLIPSYILITQYLHLNNTFLLLLISGMFGNAILLRVFMKTSVPDSLLESARMDGAGHIRIYLSIVMPLMKAGLATIGLFGFVGRWNDWFTGLLYLDKPSLIPLQTMLYKMQQDLNFMLNNSDQLRGPDVMQMLARMPGTNMVMACTVIAVVPVLIVYPFFQRYFIRGMLVGSLKE